MIYQIAAIIYLLVGFAVARKLCNKEETSSSAIAITIYFWPGVLGIEHYIHRLEQKGKNRPLNTRPRPEKKLGTGREGPKRDSSDQ